MINLPYHPRRAWLRSYGLVTALGGGLMLSAMALLLRSPAWTLLGAGCAVAGAVIALGAPQRLFLPYRVWNKLAREYAKLARAILLRVCYFVVFAAVGRAGSTLPLAGPASARSAWTQRPGAGESSVGNRSVVASEEEWVGRLIHWARTSGHAWSISLLPFLVLLSVLRSDQDADGSPSEIYTLF